MVGSGVEAALGGNWTGKIESLYLNLGNKTDVFDALFCDADQHRNSRKHLSGRSELPHRRQFGLCAGRRGQLGRLLSRRQFGLGTGRDRSTLSIPAAPLLETFNLAPDGINGGVQAGYNWQAANWVFGLEADIQGSTQKDNKTCILTCTPGLMVAFDAHLAVVRHGARAAGLFGGSTLFYATGGLAYGSIKTKINTNSFGGPVTQSFSHTNTGWTAGVGIETPFTLLGLLGPNWTTKTEYLYVDLGSTSDNFLRGRCSGDCDPFGDRARLPHRPQLPLQFAGRCEVLSAVSEA